MDAERQDKASNCNDTSAEAGKYLDRKNEPKPTEVQGNRIWDYDSIPSVTFTILRSDAGSEFVQKAIGIVDTTYNDDEWLEQSSTHRYRIIAEAKTASYTYQSKPADSESF